MINSNQNGGKRLSESNDYERPEITITELIQNKKDIQEQLKYFEEISEDDLCYVSVNTYLKYLSFNKKTKKEMFRFGGLLIKLDKEYLVLAGKNGMRFSVQRFTKDDKGKILHTTRFFKKMNMKNYNNDSEKEEKKLEDEHKKTDESKKTQEKKIKKINEEKIRQLKEKLKAKLK
jgi:hypothetical protein